LEADVSPSSGIRVPALVRFGSDADVIPSIGCRAPRLPSGVRFGSDADVSPVIGIQAPRLPLPVVVCVRVSRATNALILLRPKEIRMHRMRHPSEHVSFPQFELLRL
jgi:hypothetical protein